MNVALKLLNIQFRQSVEAIDLSSQITFFHGMISTGKSTIARLIDYCLGGTLQGTPALNQEFVSAQLNIAIGSHDVLLEREGLKATHVRATWKDSNGNSATVLAPNAASESPIWGELVFNLSDLLFFLAGITPIKVRRSRRDPDSKLVRLSFRDLMWYCYLEQDDLDSSFFRLEDDSRKYKSRDVMRFIVGFYTEQMNELEISLEKATDDRRAKEEAASQIRIFLEELEYGTELEIRADISRVTTELNQARADLSNQREEHKLGTHFADGLRQVLENAAEKLETERLVLSDLESRIADQEKLRAELLSSKFKLSREQAAKLVLSGAVFEYCPLCATPITQLNRLENECALCGTPESQQRAEPLRPEALNRDLDARIDDLSISLKQHRRVLAAQDRKISKLISEKAVLDRRLSDELETYDSSFLSNSREAERRVATLEEQLRNLQRVVRMPEALDRLAKEIAGLQVKERTLRDQIQAEKKKLGAADALVTELEDTYLQIMLAVGVPGVKQGDVVDIDRQDWIPRIYPGGIADLAYDFFSAGSGGKKTLLNVCYALAVHQVAAIHHLPLPTFLIVDSPMKNIGKEVNKETFLALYEQLYSLAAGPLRDTQFVIIDNEFAPPPSNLTVNWRYMPPPLIPGYEGP